MFYLFFFFIINLIYSSNNNFSFPGLIFDSNDKLSSIRLSIHEGPYNRSIANAYITIFKTFHENTPIEKIIIFKKNKKKKESPQDIFIAKDFFESIMPVDFFYIPQDNSYILKVKQTIVDLPLLTKIPVPNNYRHKLYNLSLKKGPFSEKTNNKAVEYYRSLRTEKKNLYNFSLQNTKGMNFLELCFENNYFYVQFLFSEKEGKSFVDLIINIFHYLYNKENAPRYCIFLNAATKNGKRIAEYYHKNWNAFDIGKKHLTFGYEAFDQERISILSPENSDEDDSIIREEDIEAFLKTNNIELDEMYPRRSNIDAKL